MRVTPGKPGQKAPLPLYGPENSSDAARTTTDFSGQRESAAGHILPAISCLVRARRQIFTSAILPLKKELVLVTVPIVCRGVCVICPVIVVVREEASSPSI